MTEPEWVPVFLGELLVGETVRAMEDAVTGRYSDMTGTVVGIRNGSVAVRTGPDTVLFWPNQLERQVRPE